MKTIVNKEEMKREWVLTNFWEKALYVIGWVSFVWFSFTFTIGFCIGILGL